MEKYSIYLRYLNLQDAEALLALRLRNRDFFQTYEPIRNDSHFTLEGQQKEIISREEAVEQDKAYTFGVFISKTNELVGRIALTDISRGPAQSANLGYFIDQQYNGKGYATEAVVQCVEKAFQDYNLHRVQAGAMPKNKRSIRVLEKAGFREIGLAKSYIHINGVWEDHVLFETINEHYRQ